MKKILILALLFSAVAFTNQVYAQFSVGAEVALPMGDFGDANKLGFGASVGYDYAITESFKVGANAGFILLLVDKDLLGDDASASMIPIQANLKYFVTEGLYLQAMAGVHMLRVSVSGISASSTKPSFGGGAGYMITENIDIGARFQIISTEGGSSNYIGARVAYSFGGE